MKNLTNTFRSAFFLSLTLTAMVIFTSCEAEEIAPVSFDDQVETAISAGTPEKTNNKPSITQEFHNDQPSMDFEPVPVEELPEAIYQFVATRYRGAQIDQAVAVSHPEKGFLYYHVTLSNNIRIQFTERGQLIVILNDKSGQTGGSSNDPS